MPRYIIQKMRKDIVVLSREKLAVISGAWCAIKKGTFQNPLCCKNQFNKTVTGVSA